MRAFRGCRSYWSYWPGGCLPIYLSKLTLTSFRNHEHTVLDLKPGLNILRGENGHGKTNLLEAVYLLAIAKSPLAASDRDLINWSTAQSGGHAQVLGVAREGDLTVQAQLDFEVAPPPATEIGSIANGAVRKSLRLNGVPCNASEFVGAVNAVLFTAEDLALVLGPPSGRRRYLDILISQTDPAYLKTLQRYQRVVRNRNRLLRRMRERRASQDEIAFWDERLTFEGAALVDRRRRVVDSLAKHASEVHRALTGDLEELSIVYRPRVEPHAEAAASPIPSSLREIEAALQSALAEARTREIAQGVSVVGPHRDDLELLLSEKAAGAFASRGQARTIALAMKLAESSFVAAASGRRPILALDDLLSELDAGRRRLVLEATASYEQVLLTTTDFDLVHRDHLSRARMFEVSAGRVTPVAE